MKVDPSMRIKEPWKCGDCVHFRHCSGMYGVKGDEPHCDFAPSRFRLDCIGVLGRLLEDAGATLTLYGEPVSADELRGFVRGIVHNKIEIAMQKLREP